MRRHRIVWVAFALLILVGRVEAGNDNIGPYGRHLARQAHGCFMKGSFREAARWFLEAEQVADDGKAKSRSAYFAGTALLKAGHFGEAVAPFQRAIMHDPDGTFSSFSRLALKECSALQDPLSNFPEGLYLWVTHRSGSDGIHQLDALLDAWDRVKWPCVAFPFLFWGGLAFFRRLRHRRA